jgi:hypothetical protein
MSVASTSSGTVIGPLISACSNRIRERSEKRGKEAGTSWICPSFKAVCMLNPHHTLINLNVGLIESVFSLGYFHLGLIGKVRHNAPTMLQMNDIVPIIASSSWAPLLQTAFGASIGFAVAVAGVVFGAWFKEQLRRQSLAAALAAEVEAVTEITGHHMVIELIQTCIASMEANGKPEYPRLPIQDHPLPVFEESVGKLGLLPVELAREVRTFYTYAIAAIQDFRTLSNENLYDRHVDELISFLQEMVRTMNRGFDLAKTLVPQLENEAKRTWNEPQQWSAPSSQQVFGAMHRLRRNIWPQL